MPKLHSIRIMVEEVAVGYVMRVLNTTPGVVKIDYEMEEFKSTPDKPNKRNGYNGGRQRANKEISGSEFIVRLLGKAGRPLTTKAVSEAFTRDGRSPHSPPSSLDGLKKQGLIESTPDGYVLSKKMKDRLRHRKEA